MTSKLPNWYRFGMAYRGEVVRVQLRSEVGVREVWPSELAFSDFLASEEGIQLIGSDLGVEIEEVRRECRANNFPCDIVANLVGNEDHQVIIENQYGRTDHDHLGKFLTYAASHNALTCIWIAERVTDDHRAAVDWLNDNTPETFSFFAAELRAFRIADSHVAPMLLPICKPNLQIKISKSGGSEASKETLEWRRQLWQDIHESLMSTHQSFRVQKANSDAWNSIALGRSNYHMAMLLTPSRRAIGLETVVQGPSYESWFRYLESRKVEIEERLGTNLQWFPKRGGKSSKVLLEADFDTKNDDEREEAITWFCEWVPKWYAAFSAYTRHLPNNPYSE